MTDSEPTTAPDPREPEGDEAGEAVQLVRTGWVRCTVGGEQYRLRPPFFGEFKRLRFAFEELQDTLDALAEETEVVGAGLVAESERVAADDSMDPAEKVRAQRELRRRSTSAAREMTTAREQATQEWWVDVFRELCVDLDKVKWLDDHDQMPAWMTLTGLPAQLLGHWRAAPLARG